MLLKGSFLSETDSSIGWMPKYKLYGIKKKPVRMKWKIQNQHLISFVNIVMCDNNSIYLVYIIVVVIHFYGKSWDIVLSMMII